MHLNIRHIILALSVSAFILPAAVSDGHEREQRGQRAEHKAGKEHGQHGRHGDKKVAYVFKGTFNLADSSVTVARGNKHVRRAGLVGQSVVFDLTDARVKVADNNADGKRDLADVQDGDKVLVQARLPRRYPGAAPFAARKLVDQSHERRDHADDEEGEQGEQDND